jgi:hypothetical protein
VSARSEASTRSHALITESACIGPYAMTCKICFTHASAADTFAELDVSTTAADPKAARTATLERIAGTVSQSRYWRNIQAAVRGDSIPE